MNSSQKHFLDAHISRSLGVKECRKLHRALFKNLLQRAALYQQVKQAVCQLPAIPAHQFKYGPHLSIIKTMRS